MARAEVSRRPSAVAITGLAAGVLGGALIDAFLSIANHTPVIQIWQFVASALVGPAAFSASGFAALGFAMHFAISIGWALLFVVLATVPLPWLARRPIAGGLAFGAFVMICMTALLAFAHVGPAGPPALPMVLTSLIAHTAFFGVPIALYSARALHR